MAFISLEDRSKPRRIYIPNKLWKMLKAHCAMEGISVSEWIRREAKKTVVFLLMLMIGGITLLYSLRFFVESAVPIVCGELCTSDGLE